MSAKKPKVATRWWICAAMAVALGVATVRLCVAFSAGGDSRKGAIVDGLLIGLVVLVAAIVVAFAVPASRRAQGLRTLRQQHPNAVVMPVSVGREQERLFREAATSTRGFRPPLETKAVLSTRGIDLLHRRRKEPLVRISGAPIAYRVDSYTTLAGTFPCLLATIESTERRTEIPLFPLSEQSGLIPRMLDREAIARLADLLNGGPADAAELNRGLSAEDT